MNAKTIKRIIIILILGFAVIFILRFIYALVYYDSSYSASFLNYTSGASSYNYYDYNKLRLETTTIQNLATAKQQITGEKGIEVNYDQKYEMIAQISADSEDFENDVDALKKAVDGLSGVIQMENTYGLEERNDRSLWISVGIMPSKFDELVEKVKTIGTLTSFSVNKTDKTAEFREYLAQREALEKTLESYNALKAQGGEIADLLVVQEKIIQTEKEISQISVTLGVYDESQSMCTIDFTLNEYISESENTGITFYMVMEKASETFSWSLMAYLVTLFFIMLTGFSALGIAFLITQISKQYYKNSEIVEKNNKNNDSKS